MKEEGKERERFWVVIPRGKEEREKMLLVSEVGGKKENSVERREQGDERDRIKGYLWCSTGCVPFKDEANIFLVKVGDLIWVPKDRERKDWRENGVTEGDESLCVFMCTFMSLSATQKSFPYRNICVCLCLLI